MKQGVKLAIVGVAGYFIGLMLGIKNKYIDG
jgi:hypothetical protein|nr:MAG TPA: hypothetical protein [Caudoviricetes sp.]